MAVSTEAAVTHTPLQTDDAALRNLISKYTGVNGVSIPLDADFADVGLESIAAVQLADELLTRFKFEIHSDELFRISILTLAKHLQALKPTVATSRVEVPSKTDSQELTVPKTPTDNEVKEENPAQPTSVIEPPPLEQQQCGGSLPSPFKALAQSDAYFEDAAKKSGFHGYWETVAPLQNDLLVAYITEAFHALGVDLSDYPYGTELPAVQHIPKYDRLVKRLLDFLESRYLVMQRGGKVLRGSDGIEASHSSELCETLRTQHPQFECEARLLDLVGPKLADCLGGKINPVSVLFGGPTSLKIMEDFYANAPMMAALTDQLLAFLTSYIRSAQDSEDSRKPIRILEVGAGTGGTTGRLASALSAAGLSVEYTFTDIGPAFVKQAKTRFGTQYHWMTFSTLDLENDIPSSFRGNYDIALGANVVHATSDRVAACRRIREMLAPGGFMVLSEVTRVVDWYDICFGLLDGWWLAEGGKGYPIQPADAWMETFERAKFGSWGFSTGESEEAESQQLLVGCVREWEVASSAAL